ncbi:hypothetical protein [Tardiphaga sp.]|jgi:hypothetical protein|uniref:hypothetical protein n=1 Tax=Tardiphaga sp. TaxID=1926292 RepID=UPI0019C03457|nr:hypothetical protein [Tardiphaga sp.]MBC7579260.1 hypothetical protein [Tardiphaga sp.]
MSVDYFRDQADDCSQKARTEADFELRELLFDLALDYRVRALMAEATGWRDAPRYFEQPRA